MAAFIAKQMIGSKLDSVKELAGDKKDDKEEAAAEDPELIEARKEEEQRRRNKYAKMESEREKVRQDIRDKYNLKKPEENVFMPLPEVEGSLNRQKKSPAQLAISTDDDEFDPMKMATNLFGSVKNSLANFSLPWGGGGGAASGGAAGAGGAPK